MTTTLMSETKTLTMKKPVISGGYTREGILISEADALDKITDYMAENIINEALEAGLYKNMAWKAITVEKRMNTASEAEVCKKLSLEAITVGKDESNQSMVLRPRDSELFTNDHPTVKEEGIPTSQRLDCIYDDE